MDVVCFTDFHHHHLCHTTLGLFLSSLLYFVFIKFVCSVYFKKKFNIILDLTPFGFWLHQGSSLLFLKVTLL